MRFLEQESVDQTALAPKMGVKDRDGPYKDRDGPKPNSSLENRANPGSHH